MSRQLTDIRRVRPVPDVNLTDFYREEFDKHRRCLEAQRDCFSDLTVAEVEAALTRVMGRLETLCQRHDCNQVVSRLLKQFDVLTGLSAWSDPKTLH
jgi:hypothetical protein